MRVVRSALLAIIAALALVAGIASTVYADDGSTSGPGTTTTNMDPLDPGIPD